MTELSLEKKPGGEGAPARLSARSGSGLELVHEAEAEPAGVCDARNPAPVPDVDVRHVRRIESVQDVEDDMDRAVVADAERLFDSEVEEREGRQIRGIRVFDDPDEPAGVDGA